MQTIFVCYTLSMARPEKQCGYIYFLLAESVSAIKIGFTREGRLEGRMADYRVHSPYEYDLLKLIPGTMVEERMIHRRFVKLKIHGEWFAYTDELKKFIDKL